MRSTVDELERDIAEMRAMASAIKPATDLLAKSANSDVKAYLSVRRRFDYSALVVALYASFERFVEDILTSYTKIIADQENYGALPVKLVNKHLKRTAELLGKNEIDQFRYPGVTVFKLVENLYKCLSGESSYELNDVAVAVHDKNIRYDELGVLLGIVELSHESVRQAQPLIDWYYNDQEMTGPIPASVPVIVVKQRLDDLVERRNDIAHRGGNPSNRLGVEEMQDLVEFVSALANSIFTVFVAHYLRRRHVGGIECERLTLVRGPFKNKSVWVVQPPLSRLHVRQPIFALSSAFLARWGRVEGLQIGGKELDFVNPGASESVGIKLDFPAPETAEVYILNTEDETIWPTT